MISISDIIKSLVDIFYGYKRFLFSIKPELYVGCITTCGIEHNRICISIYSRNNTARILSAEAITDNVIVVKSKQYPKDIFKDENAYIIFYYIKDITEPKQDLVKIEVQYSDTNGHSYKCIIVYDGQKAYIE